MLPRNRNGNIIRTARASVSHYKPIETKSTLTNNESYNAQHRWERINYLFYVHNRMVSLWCSN